MKACPLALPDAAGAYANVIDFHEDRALAVPKIRRALGRAAPNREDAP